MPVLRGVGAAGASGGVAVLDHAHARPHRGQVLVPDDARSPSSPRCRAAHGRDGAREIASAASDEEPDNGALASALETNALGWSFRTVTTQVGTAMLRDDDEFADRSFDARFDAAFAQSSLGRPSIIQRMMDPSGSLP